MFSILSYYHSSYVELRLETAFFIKPGVFGLVFNMTCFYCVSVQSLSKDPTQHLLKNCLPNSKSLLHTDTAWSIILTFVNRRFSSCLSPLFQSESECEAFQISFIHMKMNQNLRVNKTNFHMKGFALGLALKQRRNTTRKSPIGQAPDYFEVHKNIKTWDPQSKIRKMTTAAFCAKTRTIIPKLINFITNSVYPREGVTVIL